MLRSRFISERMGQEGQERGTMKTGCAVCVCVCAHVINGFNSLLASITTAWVQVWATSMFVMLRHLETLRKILFCTLCIAPLKSGLWEGSLLL